MLNEYGGVFMEIQRNFEKMEWKRVQEDSDFIHLEPGDEVMGVYVGKEPSEKYVNVNNYKIDIEGKGNIKKISGIIISKYLEKLKPGTAVKIVYKGQKQNKKGIDYNDYEIYYVPKE